MKMKILRPLLLLGSFFFFWQAALSQPANLYTFSGDVDLGYEIGPFGSSGGHCIGARGDTVYVVWSDGTIYCQKSTDGGQTFGLPVQVNSTPTGAHYGMKVDTAGVVYVAFQDFADIYFTKSTDGGQSFVPAIKVNDDTIPQTGQRNPAIAVNNKGQIFVAWEDQRNRPSSDPSVYNLFVSTSFDSGKSFSSNVQVSDSTIPVVWGIDIAADDSSRVFVVWNSFLRANFQGPTFLARSDDSGFSFPLRTLVSDLPADTSWALFPSIAFEHGIVGVAWKHQLGFDDYSLHFAGSSDYGQSFSPSIIIDDLAEPQFPSLVFKNGIFYVAWRGYYYVPSDSTWEDQVYFSYSPDMGQSFVPRVGLVQGNPVWRQQSSACLAVNESRKVFAVWSDDRHDIFNTGGNIHLFLSSGVPNVVKEDLNMDGLVTLFDVVTQINAVFLGQSFPAPFAAADINCDLKLTPVDVVLLLRMYYFSEYFAC